MLNLSVTVLAAVVEQALRDAADHPRWVAAIRRAFEELDSNPYIERGDLHGLIILSSSTANLYTSNGVCQCTAFEFGQPCWHRAAARLVRLHDEQLGQASTQAIAVNADRNARLERAQRAADVLNGVL